MGSITVDYEIENIAPGGHIGLIALATDYNSETDLRRMLPEGTDLFTNRVLNANPVTLENLYAMRSDITRAAAGILPGFGVDVMIYGCTSGTAAIGEDEIAARIGAAHPGVACTNPISAAQAALNAFGARHISILTPYTNPVNQALADQFSQRGFSISNIEGFGLDNDIEMTGLPLAAIAKAGVQICAADADALFISCTAIRAARVVEQLEAELNKPVITSNQALVWHCMQKLNNQSPVRGFGKLFEFLPKGTQETVSRR